MNRSFFTMAAVFFQADFFRCIDLVPLANIVKGAALTTNKTDNQSISFFGHGNILSDWKKKATELFFPATKKSLCPRRKLSLFNLLSYFFHQKGIKGEVVEGSQAGA